MLATQVQQWLNTPKADFAQGISLLQQVSPGNPILSVLSLGDSAFTREKLRKCLQDSIQFIAESLAINSSDAQIVEDPREKKYTPEMYFTLPENLQALEREKSACFKQIVNLRNTIKRALGFSLPNKISLTDALRAMNSYDSQGNPIPFSISWLSANLEAETGGEWKHMRAAFLSYQNKSGTRNYTGKMVEKKQPRATNHWLNGTRDIFPDGGNRLHCIHIWLIMEFNGKEVIIGNPG